MWTPNIKIPKTSSQDIPSLCLLTDFQAGAMENWGLTIFRETALEYDPASQFLEANFSLGGEVVVVVVVVVVVLLLLSFPVIVLI